MTEEIIALRRSIRRHKRNLLYSKIKQPKYGPAECPLCVLYRVNRCVKCPVATYVNASHCRKTPYTQLQKQAQKLHLHFSSLNYINYVQAAKDEIEFLERVQNWQKTADLIKETRCK